MNPPSLRRPGLFPLLSGIKPDLRLIAVVLAAIAGVDLCARTNLKLHPEQPKLPDLHNSVGEHGPVYTPPTDRFVPLFSPLRTDRAALSPDGKYVAYSVREAGTVSVVIIEADHPEKATARVTVATDETSTPAFADNQHEKTPAIIRWMRWSTPTRLVVDTNAAFAIGNGSSWSSRIGAVFAFNADGSDARVLVTPRDVLEQFPDDSTLPPLEARNPRTIWTPDQPVPSAIANSVSEESPGGNFDPPTFLAPEQITKALAQDIRILDLVPNRPGVVLLQSTGNPRSTGARSIGAYFLDTLTGKLTSAVNDVVPGLHQGLSDRAGHIRLTLPISLLTPFPHHFTYLGPTGASRARRLDEVVPATGLTGAFTLSPDNFFGERCIPLGFDDNANVLYFASNVGRDTFGVYGIDLSSNQLTAFPLEDPAYDLVPAFAAFGGNNTLIIDRFFHRLAGVRYEATLGTARWVYPSFQDVQQKLQSALPGRSVQIVEWNEAGSRFLVSANAPGDAGAFYLFDRPTSRLSEFVRRAPWIDANQTHKTFSFVVPDTSDLPLTGLMTIPNHPRRSPVPVVILCPDEPWQRARPEFSDRVQALAEMGFMVVQLNGRGAWGFGRKFRAALNEGYDLVQLADLTRALSVLEKNYNVDPKRIALLGESHGGFIALRALQSHPEKFRCAVVLNAPVDLDGWLKDRRWSNGAAATELTRAALGDAARLQESPLVRHPEQITKPVLFLHYPGVDGAPRDSTYLGTKSFAAAVRRHGGEIEFTDLSTDYARGLPKARSDVYQQIESFLNVTIYDYKVEMGELKVKESTPQKP